MRRILDQTHLSELAAKAITNYHPEVINQLESAIQKNEWVIVGMAQNPFVKKARTLLTQKNFKFEYIEHGGYLSKWKERLAIKLWSGWPTFPQVFHKGHLVGGFKDLEKYLSR